VTDDLTLESLMAAIGPSKIFEGKPTLHKHQLVTAAEYPKDIRKRMMRFLSTSEFEESSDYPKLDYDETLKLVSGGQTKEQAEALFRAVPDHELATDLGTFAERILRWANGIFPREMRDSVAGPITDEPSAGAMATFRRVWEVALNPMVIMRDLAEGCLSDDQVSTIAVLYPVLYGEMKQSVVDAVTTLAARKKRDDWEPTAIKSQLIAVLRGLPDCDPALAAAVQTVYQKEDAEPPTPKPHRPSGSTGDGSEGTPGQAASAGQ
jgi:hypothetical protein